MMINDSLLPDSLQDGALSNILPVRNLSGVRKVTMRGVNPLNDSTALQSALVGNSWRGITSLTLAESVLDSEVVRDLIEALSSLEGFKYEVQDFRRRGVRPSALRHTVDISLLRPALELRKDTLQRLSVTNLIDYGQTYQGPAGLGSLRSLHKLAHLELDEHLLMADNGKFRLVEPGKSLVCQTLDITTLLPTSLKTLILHTYTDLGDLGTILSKLSALQAHELEQLEITFPVYNFIMSMRSSERPPARDTNQKYARLFPDGVEMSSHDRRYRFEYKRYVGPMRIALRCWDLQLWSLSELEDLAMGISARGIEHFVDQQRVSVWDDDIIFGEAFEKMIGLDGTGSID
jgi:hypothetical protein